MVLLRNVSRWDSGLYECTATDPETFNDLVGSMTLSVNCKDSAPVRLFLQARLHLILTSRCARRSGSGRGGAERRRLRDPRTRPESHLQRPLFSAHTHDLAEGHSNSTHPSATLYLRGATVKLRLPCCSLCRTRSRSRKATFCS